ncbi:DUF4331 family protein [Streptomyces sp. H39-S7]|uniref:DUF4331 family protein n=1 Tax=Streptomyces sp. H39-S7 TaxID=3004357 RepID=UPI0022AF4815|nr:DUF4331 family protein [Streptomyces sp. H39-S7]MCZ4121299.1 DUF4331 family protein [Streptomyces sp. H39-S7]
MSDHVSGPRALENPVADITDFYAFPSPERAGHLVLVMNTLPFAPSDGRFSEGLVYRFRLRSADLGGPAQPVSLTAGVAEFTFDCVFSVAEQNGEGPARQDGTCTTPNGEVVPFRVDEEHPVAVHGVRVFAGPRWDPFFLDAPAALKTLATGKLAFTEPGSIFLDGKNVLSLVLEIDCALLLGGVEVLAVVAETLTRGPVSIRVERVGRPEVKNLILSPTQFDQVNRSLEIRDLYNMEDAFNLSENYEEAYRARLDANLAYWDTFDDDVSWAALETGAHPLTEFVLADYLVVDIGQPYVEQGSFLEIESAVLAGRIHQTCGGRALNDDAMDTLFTLLVNGGKGERIRDGVDQASHPATTTFPYLAAPNPRPPEPPGHHHLPLKDQ